MRLKGIFGEAQLHYAQLGSNSRPPSGNTFALPLGQDFIGKIGALPSSYLGLLLGALHNSLNVWDSIEERFRKRLALWKRQYISKGGRIMLIKSNLASLTIYFMSLFCLPRRVRLRLEHIQRKFL